MTTEYEGVAVRIYYTYKKYISLWFPKSEPVEN